MIADINEIKILRKKHGLTQRQLSQLAGVSQSLVAKVETGVIDPSYSNVKRLLEVLVGIGEKQETKAGQLMSSRIVSAAPRTTVSEAVKKMKQYGISQLPVMEHSRVIGLVSESDILESVHEGKDVHSLKVGDIMQDSPPTVPLKTPQQLITELLRVSPIIIVADKGGACGVITKADVLKKI